MIDREKHPILTESDIEDILKQLKPMELEVLENKLMAFKTREEVEANLEFAIDRIDMALINLKELKSLSEEDTVVNEIEDDLDGAIETLNNTKSLISEWIKTNYP